MTSLIDYPVALFAVLFVTLVSVVEIGRRLALRTSVNGDKDLHEQIVAVRDGLSVAESTTRILAGDGSDTL